MAGIVLVKTDVIVLFVFLTVVSHAFKGGKDQSLVVSIKISKELVPNIELAVFRLLSAWKS